KKNESITEKNVSRRSILKWAGAIAAAIAAGAVGGYEARQPARPLTITETTVMKTTAITTYSSTRNVSSYGTPAVDLRPVISQVGLKVRNQTEGAPCAVHALTFLIEYMYATRLVSDLSEEYLQYVTFQVEKPQMKGGENFWALNIGYQKWGVVPQALVANQDKVPANVQNSILGVGRNGVRLNPVFIKDWNSTTGATQDQLNQAVKFLDQNIPVAMGVLWPKNFKTHAIGGVDLMEVPTAVNKWDVVEDGHAVALVGYRSDSQFPGNGYFIYRNSWGETWGDHGYGYMPFEYILKYANDLFVYQMPTV
ncbi:MAG: C1 family peptidase, partial [Candidatus Bathyarchaeia archaeon]